MNEILIKKLLEAPGVSSQEHKVSEIISDYLKKQNFKVEYDNLGSVFGTRIIDKNRPTLLIDAHMDEVGFIITDFTDNGFIKFENLGGVWHKILPSLQVRVYDEHVKDYKIGIILIPNANTHGGEGIIPKIPELLIDIGAKNKEELIKSGIKIGNIIAFDSTMIIHNKRIIAKGVDNRLGVYMMLMVAKYLKSKKNFYYNVIIGSSSQEEVGLRGARTSMHKFQPDIAFVIDISPANDVPEYEDKNNGYLGGGTILRHKDALTIYKKTVISYLRKILLENKIKYQDYFSLGGTNAGIMQLMNGGVTIFPFGSVARNIHTNAAVFDIDDVEETLKLLYATLDQLDKDKISSL